jgi:hypothetical protein
MTTPFHVGIGTIPLPSAVWASLPVLAAICAAHFRRRA